jgi:hypothetical protein
MYVQIEEVDQSDSLSVADFFDSKTQLSGFIDITVGVFVDIFRERVP